MKKSSAAFFLFFCIFIHSFPLFAVNAATAERYMTSANEQYGLENFSKAYTYINYVLEQYDEKTVTLNVKLLAELIYYDYLAEIEKKGDISAFREFQDSVNDFPYIVSDRIQKKLDSLVPVFQKKAADEEAKKKAAAQAQAAQQQATAQQKVQTAAAQNNTEAIAAIQTSNEELAKKLQEISDQLIITQETQNQVQQIREELSSSAREIQKNAEDNASGTRLLVFILIGVIVVLIVIIVSVIIIVLRMSQRQKELFTTTLRIVSEIKKLPLEISNTTTLRIEDTYNELRKIQKMEAEEEEESQEEEEVAAPSIPKVEDKDITEDLRAELRELANDCESNGISIDKHTGRKNNSRKIAELVFKIAKEMDLGEYYSMLYFCASMVYDIGFLDIKQELFEAGVFTEEEKNTIHEHIHSGIEKLDFVPEKFRPIFVDAVCMHHENPDGSGYPNGIKGKKIPDVARIIHVVETYTAMTSKRSYHDIVDSETAIETIKKDPGKYDGDIVDILEDLI
ncbi:MAG: hypothetical protein K5930_07105 [Treponemataceae bacterium]|nr:hypothetical protein [Treponemataceae bacterium]